MKVPRKMQRRAYSLIAVAIDNLKSTEIAKNIYDGDDPVMQEAADEAISRACDSLANIADNRAGDEAFTFGVTK